MGFTAYSDLDPAKLHYGTWSKTLATAGTARYWYDDSMLTATASAGASPIPNLYASGPLAASVLDPKNGIRHWRSGSHTEHLLEIAMHSNGGSEGTNTFMLLDYVMYYPFIDCDSGDQQDMDNTIMLPRFTTGAGLYGMLVCQSVGAANGAYTITYTNQDGTSGRTSSGAVPAPTVVGQILGNDTAVADRFQPFIPLASGDTGIRSVESLTWTTPPGGFAALVLVKPIATFTTHESGGLMEKQFYQRFPEIHGDAYLSFIRNTAGAPAAGRRWFGLVTTIRS